MYRGGTTGGGPVAVLPCAEEENDDSAAPHPEWFVPIASPGPSPSPPRPASKYGPSPSKLRREPFNSEPGAWDDLQEIGSSLSEAGTAIIGGLLTLLRSPASEAGPVAESPIQQRVRSVLAEHSNRPLAAPADSPSKRKRREEGPPLSSPAPPLRGARPHGFGSTGRGAAPALLTTPAKGQRPSPAASAVLSPAPCVTPVASGRPCDAPATPTLAAGLPAVSPGDWKAVWSPEEARPQRSRSYRLRRGGAARARNNRRTLGKKLGTSSAPSEVQSSTSADDQRPHAESKCDEAKPSAADAPVEAADKQTAAEAQATTIAEEQPEAAADAEAAEPETEAPEPKEPAESPTEVPKPGSAAQPPAAPAGAATPVEAAPAAPPAAKAAPAAPPPAPTAATQKAVGRPGCPPAPPPPPPPPSAGGLRMAAEVSAAQMVNSLQKRVRSKLRKQAGAAGGADGKGKAVDAKRVQWLAIQVGPSF